MADATSVFYQIGQSVTSAVNSRFTAFTQASNSYTGTQSYSTISLSGTLDAGTASASVKSLEVLDLASLSGRVALVGANGLITADSAFNYDSNTNTLSVSNLNVTGTTASVSTTNTEIADKVITLNKGGESTNGESGLLVEGNGTNGGISYLGSTWRIGETSDDGSGSMNVTPGTLLVGGLQINVVPEGGLFGTPTNLGNYNDFIAGLNA